MKHWEEERQVKFAVEQKKSRNWRMLHTRAHSVHNLERPTRESFWVVTTIFNSPRFRSRLDLYWDFRDYVLKSGGQLMTIELAFGERPFIVYNPKDPYTIGLRTTEEIWFKENLINLAIQRLPLDWKYVAWVDSDITFANPDWVDETIQYLQHYPFIQMFSKASNIGPNFEIMSNFSGLIWAYHNGLLYNQSYKYYENFHPGFCWAATKCTLDNLGGLLDISILGSGDRNMACALIGRTDKSYHPHITKGYKDQIHEWAEKCDKYIKKNVGFLPGNVFHAYHGKKKNRQYDTRWKILIEEGYDPAIDVKKDTQGLLKYTLRNERLAYRIREYFKSRNEDDMSL